MNLQRPTCEDIHTQAILDIELAVISTERYILGGENLTFLQIAMTICDVLKRRPPRATASRSTGASPPPAAGI